MAEGAGRGEAWHNAATAQQGSPLDGDELPAIELPSGMSSRGARGTLCAQPSDVERLKAAVSRLEGSRPDLTARLGLTARQMAVLTAAGAASSWNPVLLHLVLPMQRLAAVTTRSESQPSCPGLWRKRPSSPLWATRTVPLKRSIGWFRWVRFAWEGTFSYLRDLRCCAATGA